MTENDRRKKKHLCDTTLPTTAMIKWSHRGGLCDVGVHVPAVSQGERGPAGPAAVGPRGVPGIPGERGEAVSAATTMRHVGVLTSREELRGHFIFLSSPRLTFKQLPFVALMDEQLHELMWSRIEQCVNMNAHFAVHCSLLTLSRVHVAPALRLTCECSARLCGGTNSSRLWSCRERWAQMVPKENEESQA